MDIGQKTARLSGNKILIKGAYGRYLLEVSKDQVNVLGIGDRSNRKNMRTFKNLLNGLYGLNIQY